VIKLSKSNNKGEIMICDKINENWNPFILTEDIIKKLYNDLYLSFGLTQNQIYGGSDTYKFTNNQNNEKENNKMASENIKLYNIGGTPVSVSFSGQISSGDITKLKKYPTIISQPVPKDIFYVPENKTTTVLWEDGTRTTVTASSNEIFSEDMGFLAALGKKIYGGRGEYLKFVKNGKTTKLKTKTK
jgi:hypothetical protein